MRKKSLLIQTAFLGDLLLTIPLLKRLRTLRPDTSWTLLCRRGFGSFFLKTGLVDECIEVQKDARANWGEVRRSLQAVSWDWVISPHQSIRTHLLVNSLQAQKKIGFYNWWNAWVWSERVKRPMLWPDAIRQLSLLQNLDPETAQDLKAYGLAQDWQSKQGMPLASVPAWADMSVPVFVNLRQRRHGLNGTELSPKVQAVLRAALGEDAFKKPKALLAPGSVWPTKRWRPEGFAEVARAWQKQGYTVILTGTESDKMDCLEVERAVPGVHNLCSQFSLWESIELMAISEVLVSNDSGAQHMAAVAGLPTVSIFGPTTLDLGYRPWQNQVRVVEAELKCRPCGKHGSKCCPLGTHECMHRVSSEQVLQATNEVLDLKL